MTEGEALEIGEEAVHMATVEVIKTDLVITEIALPVGTSVIDLEGASTVERRDT
jgi:hypothetical protein